MEVDLRAATVGVDRVRSLEGATVATGLYALVLGSSFLGELPAMPGLGAVLEQIQAGDLEVVSLDVASPSPRAFGLATLSDSDVVLAEDESAVLQRFHQRVLREIEDPERTVPAGGD
jgi:hypothetical protein